MLHQWKMLHTVIHIEKCQSNVSISKCHQVSRCVRVSHNIGSQELSGLSAGKVRQRPCVRVPVETWLLTTCDIKLTLFSLRSYFSELLLCPFLLWRPRVELGFCDKTLELQNVEFLPSEGGVVQGTLSVIGHELGVKKMCLDSVATPR